MILPPHKFTGEPISATEWNAMLDYLANLERRIDKGPRTDIAKRSFWQVHEDNEYIWCVWGGVLIHTVDVNTVPGVPTQSTVGVSLTPGTNVLATLPFYDNLSYYRIAQFSGASKSIWFGIKYEIVSQRMTLGPIEFTSTLAVGSIGTWDETVVIASKANGQWISYWNTPIHLYDLKRLALISQYYVQQHESTEH